MSLQRGVSRPVAGAAALAAMVGAGLAVANPSTPDTAAPRFTLNSCAFPPGGPMPRRFTADGQNLSPPLSWSAVPSRTKQLALIAEDLDARDETARVHWVAYNISLRKHELPPGVPRVLTLGSPICAVQGIHSRPDDNIGYRGPDPPQADPPHRYRFRLYALDARLDLPPGLTREHLLRRMDGHILATADLIGTYDR